MAPALEYPVVIVGAGPAGAAAAITLARRGIRPLLAERAAFPREKVCGDGLTPRALSLLKQLGLHSSVYSHPSSRRISEARAFSREGELFSGNIPPLPDGTAGFLTLPRRDLDQVLVQHAVSLGVDFSDGLSILTLEREGARCTGVRGRKEERDVLIRSPLIIGADGARSRIAREASPFRIRPRYSIVALRAYAGNIRDPADRIEIFYGPDFLPGFAWLFPLAGNTANIGLGLRMDRSRGRSLRATFQEFISGFPPLVKRMAGAELLAKPRGGFLRGYGQAGRIYSDGLLLAGDAASLVDPLTGEGISYALESGIVAGETAAGAVREGRYTSGFLRSYQKEIRRRFRPLLGFSPLFQNWPHIHKATEALALRGQRDPAFGQRLIELAAGSTPKREIARAEFLLPSVLGYWREKIKPRKPGRED